jgi:hypothetical protein
MSRFLKSLHLSTLGLGFLSVVALGLNVLIFSFLYPRVTGLMEMEPSWESYGVVAAINIIILALFQLVSVTTLLCYLILEKRTYTLLVLALAAGILSGLMVLGDISLLSDIGKEYLQGWQTRGEWMMLFGSYGLHLAALALTLAVTFRNLHAEPQRREGALKDEVLFLTLHSTGLISGGLGLVGVAAGLLSNLSLWMMERIVVILSLVTLSPYLVILAVWTFRRRLGGLTPGLDEKQFQDLATAGLRTLLFTLPVLVLFFGLQLSHLHKEAWQVLWLPLALFLSLIVFSSLVLYDFREFK